MFWHAAATLSLLLAGHVNAGRIMDIAPVARRDNRDEMLRRYMDNIIEDRRRSITDAPAPAAATNMSDWNTQTEVACGQALDLLNAQNTNPSGLAVCYNLPYVDNTTGVFKADLRLYNVSAPTGAFANIPSQKVEVALSYEGATVSAVNMSTLMARSDGTSLISWPREISKRQSTPGNSTGKTFSLVQSYAFIGQMNKEYIGLDMDSSAMEALLTPTVSLTGRDVQGGTVNTTLNTNQASFVNGAFSTQAAGVTKTVAQPPIQTLVVASESPFVVPGLNILIFPIGGVITGIWAILFIGTISYGTIGRIQFRDQFRSRTARAQKGNMSRI
ncbi:61dbb50b-23a6-4cd3-bfad-92a31efaafa2 [Sclerotinia trifoliorum]|uniref:61dbb50b-23a6-4cd3-bfad-92a31efaafa2 n=1 Tax=Sclerotinia trifoliorum TaxID=28548 RepID=A0A8H2W352_9HELO|nr:61dbb50b-23a6-4cd3-bfad-92a31efaafa2 [Sclerotinia trifoliorum]